MQCTETSAIGRASSPSSRRATLSRMITLTVAGFVVLAFVVAFLLLPMYRSAGRQAREKLWPRVQGTVVAHRIRARESLAFREFLVAYACDGVAQERWLGSAQDQRLEQAHFANPHRLRVPGAEPGYRQRRAIEAQLKRHPVGSTIDVRINPTNADETYFVEWELPARTLAFVFTALFLALAAVFFYIVLSL
jgi:hypothetical protein